MGLIILLFYIYNFGIMRRTFKEITSNVDMVLFNTVTSIDYELELEVWKEYFLYSDLYSQKQFEEWKKNWEIYEDTKFRDMSNTQIDIYQYFAINRCDGEYISRVTWMPLYYSSKCDLHILWVDFLDNWENLSYEV